MRVLLPMLFALPLLALQTQAQAAPPQAASPAAAPMVAAPADTMTAAPTATPAAAAPASPRPRRLGWKQRFAAANTTHDGHLTLQQAASGYRVVARHFAQIDVDKKGFVTVEDIDAWHKLQRTMRDHSRSQAENALRPRPAIQRSMPQAHELHTSTNTNVVPMNEPDPPGAGPTSTTTPAAAPPRS